MVVIGVGEVFDENTQCRNFEGYAHMIGSAVGGYKKPACLYKTHKL
jgi:hypothetical protein